MDFPLEDRIIRNLARIPPDYSEQKAFIQNKRKKGIKWLRAGVLVLLGKYSMQGVSGDDYFLLLNKRSSDVKQPGDLCFPGGHTNHWIDVISSHLIIPHILPLRKGKGFKLNKRTNKAAFPTITYFLGNVLREAFEEMRLNPFKVDFLGALRCYRLEQFHRTIFPIVGIIKGETKLKPNWEVDKLLKIPLLSLFEQDNYAGYRLRVTGKFRKIFNSDSMEYECFIHRENGQPDEILWGATYKITMSFLKVIFDFDPPNGRERSVVYGELYPEQS